MKTIGDIIRSINQCTKVFKTIFLTGENNNRIRNPSMISNYKTKLQTSSVNKKFKKLKAMKIQNTFSGKHLDLKIYINLTIKSIIVCV